jgi:hypothetical protein
MRFFVINGKGLWLFRSLTRTTVLVHTKFARTSYFLQTVEQQIFYLDFGHVLKFADAVELQKERIDHHPCTCEEVIFYLKIHKNLIIITWKRFVRYLTNINDVEDEPVEELEDVIAEDDVIHNAEKQNVTFRHIIFLKPPPPPL